MKYRCATVLDPRFKNVGFMNQENFKNAVSHITGKLKEKLSNRATMTVSPSNQNKEAAGAPGKHSNFGRL